MGLIREGERDLGTAPGDPVGQRNLAEIYFKGEGAGAKLTFGDLTIIQNNQALHQGGGIHLTGRATMSMNGQNNIILDNRAPGSPLGSDESGLGGGLYVKAPARATIDESLF